MVKLSVSLGKVKTSLLNYSVLCFVNLSCELAFRRTINIQQQLASSTVLPLRLNDHPVLTGLEVVAKADCFFLCVLTVNPSEASVFILFLKENDSDPNILPKMLLEVIKPFVFLFYHCCKFPWGLDSESSYGGIVRLIQGGFYFFCRRPCFSQV